MVVTCFAISQDSGSTTVSLNPPPEPIPASYFGIHLHRPSSETWPQLPFSEWRLWDSKNAIWYNLEPSKGQWDFSQLDQSVKIAEQHKIGLLLTLGQTPPWASSRPNDPPAWRHGGAAPPADEEDWKNYVRTVVTRYQGRIQAYEVWNEPNLKEFYTGTREQLFALAKDAYQIIHEIDPHAIVVSPSVTGGYDVGWFKHYLDLGGGKYADAIGYHVYSSPYNPEAAVQVIQQLKAAIHDHGLDKPLWNTESGYMIQSNFETVHAGRGSLSRLLSPDEAIGYVMRAYIVNWAAGVSRLYWYDWDSNPMGIGDNLGKQKKPAANGYATVEGWLVGAVLENCHANLEDDWVCELSRNKHREWIVWNTVKAVTKTIPDTWKVREFETLSPTGDVVSGRISGSRTLSYAPIPTLLR
jgi:hypothetical protein